MTSRPRTVVVVAYFLFAATAIAAWVGTAIFFPGPLLDRMLEWNRPGADLFRKIGPISGLFLWALGVGTFAAARGLLRGRKWAWWFAIALFAINSTGDLISFAVTHDALRTLFGAAVSGAFLIALTRDAVRRYFAQQI